MAKPGNINDDCFAEFDAAFAALDQGIHGVPELPARVTTPTPRPVSEPAPVRRNGDALTLTLDEYEDAFEKLDAVLAGAGGPEPGPMPKPPLSVSVPLALPVPMPVSAPAPVPAHDPAPVYTATVAIPPVAASRAIHAAPAPPVEGGSVRSIWRHRADGVTPIERLLGTLENLTLIQSALESGDRRQTEDLTSDVFAQVFTDAREVCREFDLETARVRADFALAAFESGRLDKLGSETAELVRHIRHDVESCSVYPLPHDRLWGFKFSAGERAAAAFPLAQAEIAEGGRCFTLGRYNATVFQMMRAAYHGVHALAAAVDSKRAVSAGAVDWSAVTTHVEARLAAVDKWRTDDERTAAHAFLSDALRDVRGLHEFAKQLADPATVFDETRALTVCHTTRDFIDRLARRITEAQPRGLSRVDFAAPGADPAVGDNLRSMPRARRVVPGLDRLSIAADRP